MEMVVEVEYMDNMDVMVEKYGELLRKHDFSFCKPNTETPKNALKMFHLVKDNIDFVVYEDLLEEKIMGKIQQNGLQCSISQGNGEG